MKIQCVVCEVGIGFSCIILIKFSLQKYVWVRNLQIATQVKIDWYILLFTVSSFKLAVPFVAHLKEE